MSEGQGGIGGLLKKAPEEKKADEAHAESVTTGINSGTVGGAAPAPTVAQPGAESSGEDSALSLEELARVPTPENLTESQFEGSESNEENFYFSSHPIQHFKLGDYEFDNGLLTLKGKKKAERFRAFLKQLPIAEQSRIRELDLRAAEEISAQVRASKPSATKAIDSSIGEREKGSKVGSGALES